MALSKIEPDKERVEEITRRMKEIIEATWLKDPNINNKSNKEFRALNKEINDMGLNAGYQLRINFDDPLNPKLEAEINIWIPKNTTIQ